MNGDYLIPANSKKSQLILGFFTKIDLIIFALGVLITMTLILAVPSSGNLALLFLILSPAMLAGFLIMPVPNYHNVLTLLGNIYRFFTSRRMYYWKGWCVRDGKKR